MPRVGRTLVVAQCRESVRLKIFTHQQIQANELFDAFMVLSINVTQAVLKQTVCCFPCGRVTCT